MLYYTNRYESLPSDLDRGGQSEIGTTSLTGKIGRKLNTGVALAAVGACAFATQAANAQQLEEIVVTAQFREARLQDTPIAITAVNAAMLEARGQTNVHQIAAQAPNVTLKPQPQNSGVGIVAFIRGVGQTDFNYALEPGVGIYVDDIYIPTLSSSLLELMDLDRVEILRGPQGTLAGKNSIGGAIKLFSAKPTGEGEGSFEVGYGSYDRIQARGFADFAITETLFARISGMTQSYDGYVDVLDYALTHPGSNVPANNNAGKSGKLGTLGGRDVSAGRIALRWMPSNRIEVNVSGDVTRESNDSGAEVLLAGVDALGADTALAPNVLAGTNANGDPWLRGVDGTPIPADCRFVPHGAHSCDTTPAGRNAKYITYANFLDGMEPTQQAPYKPYAAIPGNVFTGWGLHGNVTFDLNDTMQLSWISSWREYDSTWGMDQDGTPVPVAQLNQTLDHRAWSQEVRLNGEFADGFVDYTVGAFYFDQDGTLEARVDLNYAGIDFIHGPDSTPSTSKAAFLNTTIHPTDRWNVSGGVRYSRDEKTYTYFRSNPDGTVPFREADNLLVPGVPACEFFLGAPTAGPTGVGNTPNCLLTGLFDLSDTFRGSRWDWRIVTDYRFTDALMGYVSVSTGYKGGGVNPRPFFGPSAGECPPLDEVARDPSGNIIPTAPCNQLRSFDPEEVLTYELGFKADLLDRRLRVNAAVFYNDYKDMILTLSACPSSPCIQPRNVGEAEVKGAELEFTAFPLDNLSLDGSVSYIDFSYKDTGDSGLPLTAVTPYTPEWTYSFGVQYDFMLPADAMLSARFDGAYQSAVFNEAFNTPESKIDGYFLGNARLAYNTSDRDWQVALEVQNVFDKYYMLTKSDISRSLGLVTGQPGMPRTWVVSVRRNF